MVHRHCRNGGWRRH